MESLVHEIPPVYDRESKVLMLGSFPSPKSREQGFFYGHPRNRMWKVLAAVFGEEPPVSVEEKKAFLLRNHIAMWDVISECDIEGASDSSIKNAKANDLSVIIDCADIKCVFTTGGKAAQLYRRFNGELYGIKHIQLSSTSPANAAASLEMLIKDYSVIKTCCGQ